MGQKLKASVVGCLYAAKLFLATGAKASSFFYTPPFLVMEQLRSASLLQMLLIVAGIETNPGPKRVWDCTVCKKRTDEKKQWSVKCNSCKIWLRWDCSELSSHGRWSRSLLGQCCRSPASPPTVTTTNAISTTLKLLQLNANGLRSKIDDIID